MKFSYGVYAQLTFKDDVSVSYYLYDSESVYDHLADRCGHDIAEDASSWTEMACVGDWYEDSEFEIEMMETED